MFEGAIQIIPYNRHVAIVPAQYVDVGTGDHALVTTPLAEHVYT